MKRIFKSSYKRINALVILFVVISLLAACGDENATQTAGATPINSNEWRYDWFKDIPCRFPCWEGITPGKTTAQEAGEILGKNPRFPSVTETEKFINVKWGSITLDSQKKVTVITPNIIGMTIRFNQMLSSFGEPSHVAMWIGGVDSSRYYYIHVIYLALGTELRFASPFKAGYPTIDAALKFDYLQLFEPSIEGAKKANVWSEEVVPWEGFKDFNYYCQKHQSQKATDC
jgi:hypothetical protein